MNILEFETAAGSPVYLRIEHELSQNLIAVNAASVVNKFVMPVRFDEPDDDVVVPEPTDSTVFWLHTCLDPRS